MFRSILSRGVSAGALTFALSSSIALAQETLPTIEVGGARRATSARAAGPANGDARANNTQNDPQPASNVGAPSALTGREDPNKETGYRRTTTYSATRTDTALINTPVAVQIVPHEVIEDKQILDTMEATKNVSGVQASPDTYYDQYLIRGFASGYGATWRNGLKMEGLYQSVDTAFTDRVEVVKGPSSVIYGRVEPGGFVNVVTKRPQEEFKATLEEQAGSWGLSRTIADVTGAANAEKTLLYRVIGVYDHRDSWVNFDHRDNGAAALYLTFKPTSQFEFNTQFEHYERRMTQPDSTGQIPVSGFRGLGFPNFIDQPFALPRYFSAGDPALWNNFPNTHHRTLYSYDWTYKLADTWKITNRFHYIDVDEVQVGLYGRRFDGLSTYGARGWYYAPVRRDILNTNLDVTGEVATGPLTHRLLAGVDWYYYGDAFKGRAGPEPDLALNVWSPIYGNISGQLSYLLATSNTWNNVLGKSKQRDFGVYAQDQISLLDDRLHILLGGRYDKAEVSVSPVYGWKFADCFPFCTGEPLGVYRDKPEWSPRAAVLFKLTENASLYGSYSRSFGVNNALNLTDNTNRPPQKALQWEAGLKTQWLDGRLTASATLFDLRKKNVLEPDPANPDFVIAVGEIQSRGLELDIAGQVTENLSVIGSYTYDVAKVTNDNNNGNTGHRFNGVSPHVGNLWAKWDTAPGLPEGFEFGGGVYARSWRWGDDANTWLVPSYVTFDAMAAYRVPIDGRKVTFRLNVKNLTDKRYFDYTDSGFHAFYGAPRTVIGSVNLQF